MHDGSEVAATVYEIKKKKIPLCSNITKKINSDIYEKGTFYILHKTVFDVDYLQGQRSVAGH